MSMVRFLSVLSERNMESVKPPYFNGPDAKNGFNLPSLFVNPPVKLMLAFRNLSAPESNKSLLPGLKKKRFDGLSKDSKLPKLGSNGLSVSSTKAKWPIQLLKQVLLRLLIPTIKWVD